MSKHFRRRFGGPLDLAFCWQVRAVVALLLLGGFAWWFTQNKGESIKQQGQKLVGTSEDPVEIAKRNPTVAKSQKRDYEIKEIDPTEKNLELKGGPKQVRFLGGWNAGVMGLITLCSLKLRGGIMGLAVVGGAVLGTVCPWTSDSLGSWAWLAIGAGTSLLGMFLFRDTS